MNDILDALQQTLNPDPNIRISAELKLSGLSTQPPGTLLRKYVSERWSPFFSGFRGSAPPFEAKVEIRATVLKGLSDSTRKIRSLSAAICSLVAHCDWPDEYPELLDRLIELIGTDDVPSIHGSMQVMAEFVRSDVTEDQILPILRQLLPVLLHILGDPAKHSALTRARTISVFRQCVEALYMVKEQHPSAVSEATTTVLPTWLNAFQVLLAMDPRADVTSDDWDGLAVRTEIYRSLNIIHTSFPKSLSPYTPALLSHSLSHLQNLLPTFVNHYVQSGAVPPPSSSTDDPDQQVSLTHLASSLIDYVGSAVRTSAGRSWLESTNGALQSYIEMVAGWAQMTEEDEENWANNPNAFVAEEDDETELFSLRIAGFDLIMHFLDRVAVPTLHALQSVTHSAVQQMQNPSRPAEWWKPLEALLAVLGTHSESILEHIETEESEGRPKPIHVDALVRDIIPQLASTSEYPFLQGRAMVFASQYATTLPQDLQSQYLQVAWTVLQSETSGVPVKVSAVKAIRNFTSTIPDELVVGIAPQIIRDLAPFLLGTVEETLSLVLETLTVLLKVEKGHWLTPELATSLTSALLDVWQKNVKDLVLLSAITDVFECLAAASYQTTVTQALPLLANALGSASSDETWITSSALDIITSLMRGAQEGQLGQGFFATLGAALFKAIGESEDRDVIQNGIECLTLIVRKEHTQLAQWHDSNGRSGFENVLNFLARLLQRDQNESGGLVVGDLIIHLFRRAGDQIGPVLPELLQAMVTRIASAKTATFLQASQSLIASGYASDEEQSLIVPFALLIYSQRDTVLNMLEASAVESRSGLEVLLYAWCENAEMLQGNWPSRISILALCQLFLSDRQNLRQIYVKGDLIVKPETQNVIITRSRAKQTPHEFKSVPFPTKALQLIVRELQSMGAEVEPMNAKDVPDTTEDDSDDADEWADEEKLYLGMKRDELAFLAGVDMEDGEADGRGLDDEDLRQDPISKIDMRAHLLQFLKECAAHNINNFSQTVEELGTEEMLVVHKAINVHRVKTNMEKLFVIDNHDTATTRSTIPVPTIAVHLAVYKILMASVILKHTSTMLQSASTTWMPSPFRRLFRTTPVFSETYKSRQARAVKRKNLVKRQAIDQSSQTDRPDPVLGHSKSPEGHKLWAESDLCKILLTPEKILESHPREIPTESGAMSLPQHFNFGIKSKEEELVFRTLPDVASQQAFFTSTKSQYDPSNDAHANLSQQLEAKAKISAIHLSRLTDLRNASAAGIAVENRRRCVDAFSLPDKPNDTGRSEVQAAILTAQIRGLHSHLQQHTHDIHNRRSLRILVHKRAKILRYLKRTAPNRYAAVLPRLGLEAKAVEGELIV